MDIKQQQSDLLSERKTLVESKNLNTEQKKLIQEKTTAKPDSLKGYDEANRQIDNRIDEIDSILNKASENGAPKSANESAFSNITDTDLKAYQEKASQQFKTAADRGAPTANNSALADATDSEFKAYQKKNGIDVSTKTTSESLTTTGKKVTSETAEAGAKKTTSEVAEQGVTKGKATEQFKTAADRGAPSSSKDSAFANTPDDEWMAYRNEGAKAAEQKAAENAKNAESLRTKASDNGAPSGPEDSAFASTPDDEWMAYRNEGAKAAEQKAAENAQKSEELFKKASDNGAPSSSKDSAFANTPDDEWMAYRNEGAKAAEQKAAENAKNAESLRTKASDNGAPSGPEDSAFASTPDDEWMAYRNEGAKAAEQKAAENAQKSEELFKKASDNGAPTAENSALADTPDKEFFDYQRRNGISTPTDELEAAKKVLEDVTADASKGTKGILNKATDAVKKHPVIAGAAAVGGAAAIYNAANNEKANDQFNSSDDGSSPSDDNGNSNDNSTSQQSSTGTQQYPSGTGTVGGGGGASGDTGIAQYSDSSVSTTAPTTVVTTPPTTAAPTTAITTPPTTAAPTTAMTTPPTTAVPTTAVTTPPTSVQPTSAPTTVTTPPSTNPGTTTTTTGGTYHTGGGYTGTGGYTEDNSTLPIDGTTDTTSGLDDIKDTLTEGTASIEDVIKGSKYTKIPSTPSPVTTSSSSGGASAVIPIAAGLSAAAAAGIGAKAYMDRKKNNDNGEDEDEFDTDEWSGDDSVDIQYDDSSDNEGYLDDDDDYSYQATSSEKYDARSSDELADLQ